MEYFINKSKNTINNETKCLKSVLINMKKEMICVVKLHTKIYKVKVLLLNQLYYIYKLKIIYFSLSTELRNVYSQNQSKNKNYSNSKSFVKY